MGPQLLTAGVLRRVRGWAWLRREWYVLGFCIPQCPRVEVIAPLGRKERWGHLLCNPQMPTRVTGEGKTRQPVQPQILK